MREIWEGLELDEAFGAELGGFVSAGAESHACVDVESGMTGGDLVGRFFPDGDPMEILVGPGLEVFFIFIFPVFVVNEEDGSGILGDRGEKGMEGLPIFKGFGLGIEVAGEEVGIVIGFLGEDPVAVFEFTEVFFERIGELRRDCGLDFKEGWHG